MKRISRLRTSSDIIRVRKRGNVNTHPLLTLIAFETSSAETRICVITGKTIGSAVQRNHVKRQIRSIIEYSKDNIKTGWDLLVIARKHIVMASFLQISAAMENVLNRSGLMQTNERVQ